MSILLCFFLPLLFATKDDKIQLIEASEYLAFLPESVEVLEYGLLKLQDLAESPAIEAVNDLSPAGLDMFPVTPRSLSMRLRTLVLLGVRVDSSFFWPCSKEHKNKPVETHWPRLEVLLVRSMPPYKADGKLHPEVRSAVDVLSATGQWLLDEDPARRFAATEHD